MVDLSTDPPLFMSYDDDLYYFVNVVNYLGKLHVFWYIRKRERTLSGYKQLNTAHLTSIYS